MSIWYDVSGLYDWRGNFTGIQRAVFNIGKSLAGDGEHAHFFVYKSGNFHEIDFDSLETRLTELRQELQTPNTGRRNISVAKVRHYSMVAAKQAVIGSRLEGPLRKAYSTMKTAYRGAKPRPVQRSGNVPFGPQDIVVVVDGNWQFGGYDQLLISAKAKIGFRLVHFVHDLAAIKNPAIASKGADRIIGNYFKNIFPYADKLLAISESTKRDVIWFANEQGIKLPETSVVILGTDNHKDGVAESRRQDVADDFILAVSTVEVRKNYLLLYYTYKEAIRQSVKLPRLVIVGRKGWMADETYSLLTKDPEISDVITVLEGVNDQELERLFRDCLFTVFPSFYEGWGLTVAESLLYGKCCISSDTSSLPEVGGDLVCYTSPYDSGKMLQSILDLCNPEVRKKMERRIKTEFNPVTWQDTYSVFLNELKSLV